MNSTKYAIEETRLSYKVYMRLVIRNFAKKDIGIYNCVATNSMGKDEESIRVHGKSISYLFVAKRKK